MDLARLQEEIQLRLPRAMSPLGDTDRRLPGRWLWRFIDPPVAFRSLGCSYMRTCQGFHELKRLESLARFLRAFCADCAVITCLLNWLRAHAASRW